MTVPDAPSRAPAGPILADLEGNAGNRKTPRMASCATRVATRLLAVAALAFGLSAGIALGATGDAGDPQKAHTKHDQRWATSIVLRRADLPTGVRWTAYPIGGAGGGGTSPGCAGVRTDNSDLTETGEASSPLFIDANRQYVIVSAAWIYKSASQAKSFVQRLVRGMKRCGPAALKSQVGAYKSLQLLSYGEHLIPGTRHWFNYRIVARVHAQGQSFKSFVDIGLGQRGSATAFLILHGAYTQIPWSAEAALVGLVMARMAHAPH